MIDGNGNGNGNGGGAMVLERPKLLTTDLPETDGLSDQQRRFLDEYLQSWNATQAARVAGYKQPSLAGYRLIRNDKIREGIERELQAHHIGKDHVLARLGEMANVNIADFLSETGDVDVDKIRAKGYLVKKFTCRRNIKLSTKDVDVEDVVLEMYDAQAALIAVGKNAKMFGDENKTTVVVQFVQAFFPALDEAMLRFVAPEKRVEMLRFLKERTT